MSAHGRRGLATAALLALPVAFLGAFFVYPLAAILAESWQRGTRLPDGVAGLVADVVGDDRLRRIVWFTCWQAALSTIATMVVGLPLAHVLATYDFRGRRLVWAALVVPFVLPTVVVGAAFLALVGPNGLVGVDLDDTLVAVLAAHVFFNVAVVARTVGGLWSVLDPSVEEAARSLGAGPWRAFREATLPRLAPAVLAAASVVFLFTFTSFGVVVLLGGSRHQTLEAEIWYQATRSFDLPTAGVLAIVQLVGVAAVMAGYARLQRRRAVPQRLLAGPASGRRARSRPARLWLGAVLALNALLVVAPLVALVVRSLHVPGGIGLANFTAANSGGPTAAGPPAAIPWSEAVVNSVAVAGAATVLALLVGTLAAVALVRLPDRSAGLFDVTLMLPLGTSAVTVGFGMLLALDSPPLDIRSSRLVLPVAQACIAVPLVVRCLLPVLRSADGRLREAASVLGARPWRAWWEVDAPVLRRALVSAAGLSMAVALGEFGATVVLSRDDFPTMPVAIFRLLGRPGPLNEGRAMALAVVLMGVTTAVVLLLDRADRSRVGSY